MLDFLFLIFALFFFASGFYIVFKTWMKILYKNRLVNPSNTKKDLEANKETAIYQDVYKFYPPRRHPSLIEDASPEDIQKMTPKKGKDYVVFDTRT